MRSTTSLFGSLLLATALAACGSSMGTDAGTADSGAHDSGAADSGAHDSGATDSGAHDSGATDSGTDAGATDSGTDAGTTDSGTDAGTTDSGTDAGGTDAGASVVCTGHDVTSFPTFDQSCTTASDCVIVTHQTDCCGNSRTIGVNASDAAAFAAAEASCEAMFPGCGCPTRPSVTDSGENVLGTPAMVTCAGAAGGTGMCFTYVSAPPP